MHILPGVMKPTDMATVATNKEASVIAAAAKYLVPSVIEVLIV